MSPLFLLRSTLCSILFLTASIQVSATSLCSMDNLQFRTAGRVTASFDSATDLSCWFWENWSKPTTLSFDPAVDAGNNPNSGSVKIRADFLSSSDWQETWVTSGLSDNLPADQVRQLSFSVKVGADSSLTRSGGYGNLELRARVGPSWQSVTIARIALQGGWSRVVIDKQAFAGISGEIHALTFQMGGTRYTGPIAVHLDDFEVLLDYLPRPLTKEFDAASDVAWWYAEEWATPGQIQFDPTVDRNDDAASGSARLAANFAAAPGYQVTVFTGPISMPLDGQIYDRISFDVKLNAAASLARVSGPDYAHVKMVARHDNWSTTELNRFVLTDSGWVRVHLDIPPQVIRLHHLSFWVDHLDFSGPVVFNVDNITWSKRPADQGELLYSFDRGATSSGWYWENWSRPSAIGIDPADDSQGFDASGSLAWDAQFPAQTGWQSAVITAYVPLSAISTGDRLLTLDVRVDEEGSTLRSGAQDYGLFEVIARHGPGWDWSYLQGIPITGGGWHSFAVRIPAEVQDVHHLTFAVSGSDFVGPVRIKLDNIRLGVYAAPVDSTPPEIYVPAGIVVEATDPAGALIYYEVTAADDSGTPVILTLDVPSGSWFAVGNHVVTAHATDTSGNRSSRAFSVIVKDTTAPALTIPQDIVAEAVSSEGAVVNFEVRAWDIVDGPIAPVVSPVSGATFPIGTTEVHVIAADRAGNQRAGSFFVTVNDTTPPVVESVSLSLGETADTVALAEIETARVGAAAATDAVAEATLWPPDRRMVQVHVAVSASDAVDAAPVSRIVAVAVAEDPLQGRPPITNASGSWRIVSPLTAEIRAEHTPSSGGRTYVLSIETTDYAGNVAESVAKVRVPAKRR